MSKKENIRNNKKKVVDEILIQETTNRNYYREIVTGKLIPVVTREEYRNAGSLMWVYEDFLWGCFL